MKVWKALSGREVFLISTPRAMLSVTMGWAFGLPEGMGNFGRICNPGGQG